MQKRKRFYSKKCTGDSITDKSMGKHCDINNIMKQYAKTGQLPSFNRLEPKFQDNMIATDLTQAFEVVHNARDAFMDLPAEVRKAINNDPSQIANLFADDRYKDLLLKHGLIEEKVIEKKRQVSDTKLEEKTSEKQGENDGKPTNDSGPTN